MELGTICTGTGEKFVAVKMVIISIEQKHMKVANSHYNVANFCFLDSELYLVQA